MKRYNNSLYMFYIFILSVIFFMCFVAYKELFLDMSSKEVSNNLSQQLKDTQLSMEMLVTEICWIPLSIIEENWIIQPSDEDIYKRNSTTGTVLYEK